MSDDKNYFIPATYINSERYYQNKTNVNGITDIETYNLKKWFLGDENVKFLIKKLFVNYLKHEYNHVKISKNDTYRYFKNTVPKWIKKFVSERKVEFHSEDPDVIREDYANVRNINKSRLFRHFIDSLSRVNREFFKEYKPVVFPKMLENPQLRDYGIHHDSELPGLTGVPDWNPFRASTIVGTKNEFENTLTSLSYHDMVYGLDNTRNMDVWDNNKTIRMNKNFRYNNRIPVWQWSMNRRNYDRSNDGLEHGDPNRASLEVPIRGYEMSDIYKNAQSSLQYNKYGTKGKW